LDVGSAFQWIFRTKLTIRYVASHLSRKTISAVTWAIALDGADAPTAEVCSFENWVPRFFHNPIFSICTWKLCQDTQLPPVFKQTSVGYLGVSENGIHSANVNLHQENDDQPSS